MSIYTISTVDHYDYKKLVCGRKDDITKLLEYISLGRSVALFGDKRIGKTLLLYILRDIINRKIDIYQSKLIDIFLRDAIQELQNKTLNHKVYKAAYLSLQSLTNVDIKSFIELLCRQVEATGLAYSFSSSVDKSFSEVLTDINNALLDSEQLVILIDEAEILMDINEGRQLFVNLRSAIQSCSKICFVLAGAEIWHKQMKEKTLDFINNVEKLFLGVPTLLPLEKFLIREPLAQYIQHNDLEEVVKTIINLTGHKPFYVQAVCDVVTRLPMQNGVLPENWKVLIEKEAQQSVESALEDFYGLNYDDKDKDRDDTSKKILALIANIPMLTGKNISKKLGINLKMVASNLDNLEILDKVYKQGKNYHILGFRIEKSKYRILGLLIEKWGKSNREIPHNTTNPWIIRLKWIGAITFSILAIAVYFYTHPSLYTHECSFQNGKVFIKIPSSLEQDETGKAIISVLNQGVDVSSIAINLNSDTIDYQHEGTNRLKFEKIATGEKQTKEISFIVRQSQTTLNLISQPLINLNSIKSPIKCSSFEIYKRPIPMKNSWILISSLLAIISSFAAKPDLLQLVTGLINGLLKPQEGSKS